VGLRGLVGVALCAALVGCGAPSSTSDQTSTHVRAIAQPKRRCQGSKLASERQRQWTRLNADLRRLRAAAATVKGYTQNGNAAINTALDRFMLDVAGESLPIHERSRFIDRAAAIVAPRCYLCFQALESNRPIAGGSKLACG
jgi:hypothetical protein